VKSKASKTPLVSDTSLVFPLFIEKLSRVFTHHQERKFNSSGRSPDRARLWLGQETGHSWERTKPGYFRGRYPQLTFRRFLTFDVSCLMRSPQFREYRSHQDQRATQPLPGRQ